MVRTTEPETKKWALLTAECPKVGETQEIKLRKLRVAVPSVCVGMCECACVKC